MKACQTGDIVMSPDAVWRRPFLPLNGVSCSLDCGRPNLDVGAVRRFTPLRMLSPGRSRLYMVTEDTLQCTTHRLLFIFRSFEQTYQMPCIRTSGCWLVSAATGKKSSASYFAGVCVCISIKNNVKQLPIVKNYAAFYVSPMVRKRVRSNAGYCKPFLTHGSPTTRKNPLNSGAPHPRHSAIVW